MPSIAPSKPQRDRGTSLRDVFLKTVVLMSTRVTIQVIGQGEAAASAVDQGFEWFRRVEACCTRFDPDSELMRLGEQIGEPVEVSDLLFEAARGCARQTAQALFETFVRRWT